MKILLVGHRPYVGWLCQGLLNNGFLDANPIDVIVVTSVQKKPGKKKRVKRFLNIFKKFSLHKLKLKLALKIFDRQNAVEKHFSIKDEIPETAKIKHITYNNFFLPGFTANYDLMLVATYGGKIENQIFEGPPLGTWNIHPSVLPQLKGGYPTLVQALDRNFHLGTTIHTMTEKIDEGKIVAQRIRTNNESIPNHTLFQISAMEAADMLLELKKNDFKPGSDFRNTMSSSVCKQIHKPDWYLGNYKEDVDVQSLVNAYAIPHMFPFIYYFQGTDFIQLLSVDKAAKINKYKNKIKFLNLNDVQNAELIFYGKSYPLLGYIKNGKLFEKTA